MKMQFLKKVTVWVLSAVMAISSVGILSVSDTTEVQAAASSSSTLVWSDEFNGSSLDTSKWSYEIGTGSSGWGNNELEYYTDRSNNLYVSDGALHIRAQKESYNGSSYTSARINTKDKFEFTYGYVEARIAIPSCQGIWPAFWMLGANIDSVSWPACGEIDIMEAINSENLVYGTCHWDCNGHASYGTSSSTYDITQYHVYGLEWDSEYIRVYVDGSMYYEIYIANGTGGTEELHNPYYLLLNVAVGGNWPGFSVDDSAFPQEMKVDYIRVYQDSQSYTSSSSSSVDTGSSSSSSSSSTSTSDSGMGMTYESGSTATAYVNDSSWVDIHYSINGGGQQNVRMDQNGTKATYTISGLSSADTVTYWFTYSNTSGYTVDTSSYTYTHSSGSSSSGSSSSSSSGSSVNTTTGEIYIYQDADYGGRSASLGEGSYTLASLQAKGFQNDELSAVKVPFGYKVTLYEDDNFSGATLVLTSDTLYVGSSFNDKTSSIVVEKAQYWIVNRYSGLVLDVASADTSNGANVQQWVNNGTDAQKWYITQNSDYSYTITSVLNGKALDVDGWATYEGANVQMWDLGSDQANQQWWITELGNGYSSIINKYSNLSLDVADWSVSSGGNIQQYGYNQQENQQWQFQLAN